MEKQGFVKFPTVLGGDGHVVNIFFFNDTATTEIYTLSLHDALPIFLVVLGGLFVAQTLSVMLQVGYFKVSGGRRMFRMAPLRSEEHTSELQSRQYLVCRLLLEKKN